MVFYFINMDFDLFLPVEGKFFWSNVIVGPSVGYWARTGSSSDPFINLPMGCWSLEGVE